MKKFISICLSLILFFSVGSVCFADDRMSLYEDWCEDEKGYAYELCEEYDVPYSLVVAICYHESRFKNDVGETYKGLMQVGDTKDIKKFLKRSNPDVFSGNFDLFDGKTNLLAGITMLDYYIESSDNIEDAVCKYSCGEGNFSKRMSKGQGYCKPAEEIIELMEYFDKELKDVENSFSDEYYKRLSEDYFNLFYF